MKMNRDGRRSLIALLLGLGWFVEAGVALAVDHGIDLTQQAAEVAAYLEGSMDTMRQAQQNPKVAQVRMTTCRIQLQATPVTAGSIYLYQEQAIVNDLTKPYRQRFLQIAPSSVSQSIRSLSFRPVNTATWVNLCDRPSGDRVVQQADLGQPVCSVFLRKVGDEYVGNTPIDGCAAQVRGVVRITNHIVLRSTGMDTWDRGFDANGQQVWGAKTESYQFRRP